MTQGLNLELFNMSQSVFSFLYKDNNVDIPTVIQGWVIPFGHRRVVLMHLHYLVGVLTHSNNMLICQWGTLQAADVNQSRAKSPYVGSLDSAQCTN